MQFQKSQRRLRITFVILLLSLPLQFGLWVCSKLWRLDSYAGIARVDPSQRSWLIGVGFSPNTLIITCSRHQIRHRFGYSADWIWKTGYSTGFQNKLGFVFFWDGAYHTLGIPFWFTILFTITAAALCFTRFRGIEMVGRCPSCGYDIRATPIRCPECGQVLTPA